MMKAVAVPYIIAILLGVGVIGLIGYWLFVSGGQFGAGTASQQCRNDFLQSCTEWGRIGYRPAVPGAVGVFTAVEGNECAKAVGKDALVARGEDATKDEWKKACGVR